MLDHLIADLRSALFPGAESDAVPVMDGPLRPNHRLDAARVVGEPLPEADDVAVHKDGTVFVSSGTQIVALSGRTLSERRVFAECNGPVGPLAMDGETVLAGVAGQGVVRLDRGGTEVARLASADGRPLRCTTALARMPDGRIAIADGSERHAPGDWCRDLLERGRSGRIAIAPPDLKSAATVCDRLAWPFGLMVSPDNRSLWFTESWRHRISTVRIDSNAAPVPIVPNLPGYPARLATDGRGGAWLAVFALRTQLVEFVLRERKYCDAMLATVDPRYWIAPSLRALGHYLEPLQGGGIKKLGLVKPWAPPRSYGLIVRLSGDGDVVASQHSRAGGRHHGITAVRAWGERLLVVAKGHGLLLDADGGPESAP